MAEHKTMSKEELHRIIDSSVQLPILVLTSDLEKRKDCGSRHVDKEEGKKLVNKSKTIIAIIDDDNEEDSFDVYALYTALQEDIENIKSIGLEHKMIMPPED